MQQARRLFLYISHTKFKISTLSFSKQGAEQNLGAELTNFQKRGVDKI